MAISDRYETKIAEYWSDHSKIGVWNTIELLNLKCYDERVYEKAKAALQRVSSGCIVDQARMIEERIGHEVEAYLQYLNQVYPSGLWHRGLASSDLVECSTAIAMNKSMSDINEGTERLINKLKVSRDKLLHVIEVGYTHGQIAEPITWGYRIENWLRYIEEVPCKRNMVGKISGATGTGVTVHPKLYGLVNEAFSELPISTKATTQIVPRSELAARLQEIGLLVLGLQKIANDLRVLYTLNRVTVTKMPVGSSSMPHKVNPYELERVIGMCRMVASMIDCVNSTNADNWLERDLVNSVVERESLPNIYNYAYYCVDKMIDLVDRIEYKIERPPDAAYSSIVLADSLMHTSDRKKARADAARGLLGGIGVNEANTRIIDHTREIING